MSGATSLVTIEKHPLRIINVIQNRGRHKASYHDNDIYLSIAQLKKHPTLTLSTINTQKKKLLEPSWFDQHTAKRLITQGKQRSKHHYPSVMRRKLCTET